MEKYNFIQLNIQTKIITTNFSCSSAKAWLFHVVLVSKLNFEVCQMFFKSIQCMKKKTKTKMNEKKKQNEKIFFEYHYLKIKLKLGQIFKSSQTIKFVPVARIYC